MYFINQTSALILRFFTALIGILAVLPLAAQEPRQYGDELYRPQPRQPGKDVMWLSTPDALVVRMGNSTSPNSSSVSEAR
ncbi:MAG: hypothetical protein H0T80_16545 [Betaproteobacteria bacterium]|nr:hypothetical protein [Betaproteobacteria bacterium]